MNPQFMLSNLSAIMPALIVMLTGMIILLGDSCMPTWKKAKSLNWIVSLIGILYAAVQSWDRMLNGPSYDAFGKAIIADQFGATCNILLLLAAALSVLLATTYLENRNINHGEYYALLLLATSGAMLMVQSADLITLFVAVETLSIALYVLSGFARTEARSEEAALKYFLLGAFAAGFLLYGIALVYGGSGLILKTGGTTNILELGQMLVNNKPNIMLMSGIALLIVGLGFKAALVPFHMWTPDVYEGAPTSVTAYMSAAVKIAAVAAILRLFSALTPIAEYWMIALQVMAVLTMYGGNILAVTQDNVKRMLAYSSIAHAGYLLVGIVAATTKMKTMAQGLAVQEAAYGAIAFYLFSYTLMTIGSFGVLIWLSKRGRDFQTMSDLKGLGRTDPAMAYIMLVFMLSFGGIPLTMGFWGKWFLFNATLLAGQTWLALALAGASVISIYYYLKVVWTMGFQEPEDDAVKSRASAPGGVGIAVGISLLASLAFGFIPGLIQPLMTAAASMLR